MARSRFSLLLVLILALAACGPTADSPAATEEEEEPPPAASPGGSPAEADGAGELAASGDIFAHGVSYETTDSHSSVRVDVFTEQYPDVSVEFSESGFEAEVFLASLQGGDAPDVVRLPRNIIGTYIHRGVLAPLDDCISRAGVDTSIYLEPAINQVTVDGTLYALPDFYNTVLWVVNDAAFEEAGLDPANFDFSDWDAIAAANEDLLISEGGALSRIGIDPKMPEMFLLWTAAAGGTLLSEDGQESLLESAEAAEALDFTVGLIDAHGGATAFTDFRGSPESGDPFGAENQYVLNTVGAAPWEQFYINALAGNSPDAPVSGHAFLSREGDPITLQTGDALAIVEGTDNYDAACAFITTMVSTDAWIEASMARKAERDEEGVPYLGLYTANTEVTDEVFSNIVDLSDTPNFEEAVQVVIENQANAVGFPPSPAGEECDQAILDAVNNVFAGDPAADALTAADEECQGAIDDAQ